MNVNFVVWLFSLILYVSHVETGVAPLGWKGEDLGEWPPAIYVPVKPAGFKNPFSFQSKSHINGIPRPVSEFQPHSDGVVGREEQIILESPFSVDESPMSADINAETVIRISGFQYCSILDESVFWRFWDNSKFNRDFHVDLESVAFFVTQVDINAEQIVQRMIDVAPNYRPELRNQVLDIGHLQSMACYFVADGKNSAWKWSERKLLVHVSGHHWFPGMGWPLTSNTPFPILHMHYNRTTGIVSVVSNNPKKTFSQTPPHLLKHYRIAYTILAHDNFHGLKYLVSRLCAPKQFAFIMIHIDAKNPQLRTNLSNWLADNPEMQKQVRITEKSYRAGWGLSEIVHAQLHVYFNLLDTITFEYVVNLSGSDVPLMPPDLMYSHLRWASNPQANYFTPLHKEVNEKRITDTYDRINRPVVFRTTDGKPLFFTRPNQNEDLLGYRIDSCAGYKYYLTDQWHILTFAFVNYLRMDPVAPTLLVPMQYGFLIDEVYFSVYSQWNDVWASTIEEQKQTRCLAKSSRTDGPGNFTQSKEHRHQLFECMLDQKFIARKWYIDSDPQLIPYFDDISRYAWWVSVLPRPLISFICFFQTLLVEI